ncbi:MAG: DsbA family protein [Pseudomonadota bacterium]
MPQIRAYFAYRSPYSRLGLHQLAASGLEADVIPFTGPPEGEPFRNANLDMSSAYYSYVAEDVLRETMRAGLPIAMPDPFDIDFTPAINAFLAAKREGAGLAFAIAASDARWGEGKNLSDLSVLKDVAHAAGLAPNLVEAAQADAQIEEDLREGRKLIEQDRVFGVPFFVSGDQKYWGQDRFNRLLEDLEKAKG